MEDTSNSSRVYRLSSVRSLTNRFFVFYLKRSVTIRQFMLVNRRAAFLIFCLVLSGGCYGSENLMISDGPEPDADIRYSVVYVIHADANYRYHDGDGVARRADKKVLDEALKIARASVHGEVFIFNQLPRRRVLGLFPRSNRQFIHYRNGDRISQIRYGPASTGSALAAESRLFHENRAESSHPTYFLYFGHQIPDYGGTGYHHSQSNIPVNVGSFAEGLGEFTQSEEPFALTVLSSCNNGSPLMARLLQPYTDYLLASPQNLHLSYIDTKALLLLEQEKMPSGKEIATAMAEESYHRLARSVHTAVSLSVYDMNHISGYITTLEAGYRAWVKDEEPNPLHDNTDCAELPFFDQTEYSNGVSTWFRPARFGRPAASDSHSGWGCRRK